MINEVKRGELIFTGITVNDLLLQIGQLLDAKTSILPSKSQSEYLSRTEVANQLQISLPTLNEWTKLGWLLSYKMGNRVLYKAEEVELAVSKVSTYKYKKGGRHGA